MFSNLLYRMDQDFLDLSYKNQPISLSNISYNILYVQEILSHLMYSNLLYRMVQDFLDILSENIFNRYYGDSWSTLIFL